MSAERRHMGRVAALGCIVCRRLGLGATAAEVHHLRDSIVGKRRSTDFETMPLCYLHHRGADGIHHLGVKAWERRYWPQRELLAATLEELEESASA